jgi:hypothetical protein
MGTESDDPDYVARVLAARAPEIADALTPLSEFETLLEIVVALESRLVELEQAVTARGEVERREHTEAA